MRAPFSQSTRIIHLSNPGATTTDPQSGISASSFP